MSRRPRRNHSPAFKAKVALAAVRGEKTLADPRHIEDVLDRDLPTIWREEDARAAAEARRRVAGKAALTRAGKGSGKDTARATGNARDEARSTKLEGWDEFAVEGLLR